MSSYSLASNSVTPAALPTVYNVNTSHKKNETSAQAINIGNLTEESQTVSVSDEGAAGVGAVSASFVAQDGTTSLAENFSNFVDQISSRFQLADAQGNIIADSQGTNAQQAAFSEWVDGTLAISAGTYTATATPNDASPVSLSVQSQEQQGTSLQVSSSLTGSDSSEYYNFSFSGSNIKLAFDAGTATNQTRVQLLDNTGHIVADSGGNSFQRAQYAALTSGSGLSGSTGNYTVKGVLRVQYHLILI